MGISRWLLAVALVAGCAASAPASTRVVSRPAALPLSVLSVSFVSAADGWLLATPCADHPQTCRTVVLRKTVDGGRTWLAVPAPAAPPADAYQASPPADAVGTIVFTSASQGWAFGPALWRTTDGGASWQRVRVPGEVRELAAGAGRVVVLTERCRPDGWPCSAQVYGAATGTADWRAVPGAGIAGIQFAGLAVSGAEGYLLGTASQGQGRPVLLGGSVTGSARWRPLPSPCDSTWTAALATAPGGWLFLGCGTEPGAGQQVKVAYLSANGGRTWHEVTSPPSGGYLGSASMNSAGTIFLSGQRMDVYISRDRGRSWYESPSLANAAGQAGAGFSLAGSTVTSTFGYVFEEGVSQQQLWLSDDDGRTWVPSTIP
jgi:photosystem II stability/assembly factor-like uncharacterized protein